jgi:hypothetical protein
MCCKGVLDKRALPTYVHSCKRVFSQRLLLCVPRVAVLHIMSPDTPVTHAALQLRSLEEGLLLGLLPMSGKKSQGAEAGARDEERGAIIEVCVWGGGRGAGHPGSVSRPAV